MRFETLKPGSEGSTTSAMNTAGRSMIPPAVVALAIANRPTAEALAAVAAFWVFQFRTYRGFGLEVGGREYAVHGAPDQAGPEAGGDDDAHVGRGSHRPDGSDAARHPRESQPSSRRRLPEQLRKPVAGQVTALLLARIGRGAVT